MKQAAATLFLVGLATGAPAASPISPGEFAALSAGKTLYFDRDGTPFGAEQYFPGQRSLWRFDATGDCIEGRWRADGDRICFFYDGADGPECWHFWRDGSGLRAMLVEEGAETGSALDLDHSDDRPLDCPGPDVGS